MSDDAEPLCTVCMRPRRVFGCDDRGCYDQPGTAMSPQDRPRPRHPAPWRWDGDPFDGRFDDVIPGSDATALRSATGTVLAAASRVGDRASITFYHPRVRALTEAAPELEALLREALNTPWRCTKRLGGDPDDARPCLKRREAPRCLSCRVFALLGDIDERAKGGG